MSAFVRMPIKAASSSLEDYDTPQEEVRPSSPWSEERYEELWDRVEGVRHKLTRILNPAKLTPFLRQCKVIDEQDEDEVLTSTQYPLRISKADRPRCFLLVRSSSQGPWSVGPPDEQTKLSQLIQRQLSQPDTLDTPPRILCDDIKNTTVNARAPLVLPPRAQLRAGPWSLGPQDAADQALPADPAPALPAIKRRQNLDTDVNKDTASMVLGRLLDILRGQGQRGLQAFMESLEFYHPEQYTQLTGQQPTQHCSLILDEEGPEGLTQFLLLEVRKMRDQLRQSRMSERRLSQRCRVAEEERSRAEHKAQELRHDRLQLERLRQDWESGSRELGKLKDRYLEQALKYSRALEEQGKASSRERELLRQLEELKSRLREADMQTNSTPVKAASVKRNGLDSHGAIGTPPPVPEKPLNRFEIQKAGNTGAQALMDILQQDRREATEQRQELCNTITRLQEELQSTEEYRDKLESQCEQLQLKVRTLQLDLETDQKTSVSYFNQIMELEKERDQALRSRDSLQLEYTDCLLDKNRLRKRIAELQANMEQQQRELERERERSREQTSPCLHCSHLSLCTEDQCYGPCCSLDLDLCVSPQNNGTNPVLRKTPSRGQANENSGDSCSNSEENLLSLTEGNEKEINRLSTFPFPPCMNSINRRFNTEFELDSWGSDENDNPSGEQSELSWWDSWSSLHCHLFPPDLVNLPPVPPEKPHNCVSGVEPLSPSSSPPTTPKRGGAGPADDITIVGGNRTGIFVSHVRAGSPAELCGLKEGSELLELERVLLGGGSVLLSQCTGEVAHFSLQWWTDPSSLKHQSNAEAYAKLSSQLSAPTFQGADSFYVRVNLDIDPHGDPPCLGARCDDIIHVKDTRYNGKYQWRCSLVDPCTVKPLQAGAMPNYNRAQQLLLVRLRTMALGQKDLKKKGLSKKGSGRVRLVKAVAPTCRSVGATPQVLYTLSHRHEEHLIPYSLVQPVQVKTKRPVIFSPSLLSRGLIERLLQPADSGLDFNTCSPEPILASERCDKKIFLLDTSTPEQALGIRLQSIQEVISQDKHCLLELGLTTVEGLLRHGVYPIVIHIRPKNKTHKKLRKLLPRRGEEGIMEEVCQAEELQLENLPMLYHILEPSTWSCTEELLSAIRNAILSQQRAVAWVVLDRLQ